MREATFEERGLPYASELALANLRDLRAILEWNVANDVDFYRCTSDLVPWHSRYDLVDLPDYDAVERVARECGDLVREAGLRLTFHPDHFCKLASESADTVERAVTDLENHGAWLDLMGLERSPYYAVNVHVGGHYGDKAATAERFRAGVERLSPAARERLTVENDDRESLWSVPELVGAVADPLGVPVTFDYHHHQFADRGLTYREAFERAAATWPCRPVAHFSDPARLHALDGSEGGGEDAADASDDRPRPQAHADHVARVPRWLTDRADVMLEAGAKERALFALRDAPQDTYARTR
jgi:UV DNA damage endonuclease